MDFAASGVPSSQNSLMGCTSFVIQVCIVPLRPPPSNRSFPYRRAQIISCSDSYGILLLVACAILKIMHEASTRKFDVYAFFEDDIHIPMYSKDQSQSWQLLGVTPAELSHISRTLCILIALRGNLVFEYLNSASRSKKLFDDCSCLALLLQCLTPVLCNVMVDVFVIGLRPTSWASKIFYWCGNYIGAGCTTDCDTMG